jgi:hypothetical protein
MPLWKIFLDFETHGENESGSGRMGTRCLDLPFADGGGAGLQQSD